MMKRDLRRKLVSGVYDICSNKNGGLHRRNLDGKSGLKISMVIMPK